MKLPLFRRRCGVRRRPFHRFLRPLVEGLESRDLLAFNLTISTDATVGVSSVTASGTTTFTATADGANLFINDISSALVAGNNVVVSSGSAGIQSGNISTDIPAAIINGAANTSLTIKSGSGVLLVGNITLPDLIFDHPGSLIVQANNNAIVAGSATTVSVSAANGSINPTANGDLLQAQAMTLTAHDGIGTAAQPLKVSVDSLTANTSSGDANQFITEANGLTALNLNAGAGNVTLNVTAGGVTDADTAADITAASAVIALNDAATKDFGQSDHAIETSVDLLSVTSVAGGGSQFIAEDSGLTSFNFNAGSGNVSLIVDAGAVSDSDSFADILAANATVTPHPHHGG
jgi:hypothetical protein